MICSGRTMYIIGPLRLIGTYSTEGAIIPR
jgi:hypothetical protein